MASTKRKPASSGRLGLWLIGAAGNVAATVAVGLAAVRRGGDTTGLTTALPMFAPLHLRPFEDIVLGGHEVRDVSPADTAAALQRDNGLFGGTLLRDAAPLLDELAANARPGTLAGSSKTLEALASTPSKTRSRARHTAGRGSVARDNSARATIDRLRADLRDFQQRHKLQRVVVINVASTEPPVLAAKLPREWNALDALLAKRGHSPLPASSLYAVAAIEERMPYVNFTPSLGVEPPAIHQLADIMKVPIMGRDGKTGETLLKSVLTPMFRDRNLRILSWDGHNVLGNLDGYVLSDPAAKPAKLAAKQNVVAGILGYEPQTRVSIEYVESMGDWKTAWDHVHFRGFLGTKMTLQFTWQGCDSILAAPLVIDLARLADHHSGRGLGGVMKHLACFFKSPMETAEHDFRAQTDMLRRYIEEAPGEHKIRAWT